MASLNILDAAARRTRPMAKKNWIRKAVPKTHEGRFTDKANAAGETVHEFAEEKKDAGGTLGKEANLALNFEGMAATRKRRRLRDHYKKKG